MAATNTRTDTSRLPTRTTSSTSPTTAVTSASAPSDDSTSTSSDDSPSTATKPGLKFLFDKYKLTQKSIAELEAAVESDIKAILVNYGAGPYRFDGKLVKIKKRDYKNEKGEITSTKYFFTGIGDEIQDVG